MTRKEAGAETYERWGRYMVLHRSRAGVCSIHDRRPGRTLVCVGEGATWREACDAAERSRLAPATND